MPVLSGLVRAVGTLTSTGTNVSANDTVTVGGVVYTFKASVTTTANEVLIGADAAASLANLKSAINLDGTAVYGSATVENPHVTATTLTSTTLKVEAKVAGTIGNLIASTESAATLSWGGAVLASGAGFLPQAIEDILSYAQVNSEVLAAFDEIL